jgi:hypothetical protein
MKAFLGWKYFMLSKNEFCTIIFDYGLKLNFLQKEEHLYYL